MTQSQMKQLAAAVAAGVARVRQITDVHWLVHVADRGLAALVLNGHGGRFDFSRCATLTRPQAKRALRLLDAPQYVRAALERLLYGRDVPLDCLPRFCDYASEGGRDE